MTVPTVVLKVIVESAANNTFPFQSVREPPGPARFSNASVPLLSVTIEPNRPSAPFRRLMMPLPVNGSLLVR